MKNNKRTRRLFSMLLSMILALSMMPASCCTAFGATEGSKLQEDGHVCKMEQWTDTLYYSSLESALKEVEDWGTIELLKDVSTDEIKISNIQNVTIKLNGHKIAGTAKNGVVFSVTDSSALNIEGWEEGSCISGTVCLGEGSSGSISLSELEIENKSNTPIIVSEGCIIGSTVHLSGVVIETSSNTAPAVSIRGNANVTIWNSNITAAANAIEVYKGKLETVFTDITSGSSAILATGSGVSKISINGGNIKGEYAFNDETAEDTAKLEIEDGNFDGKFYSKNNKYFITGGSYTKDVSTYCDLAYVIKKVLQKEDKSVPFETSFIVQKRGEGRNLKKLSISIDYEDGGQFDDELYYITFKGLDLGAKIEQFKEEAQGTANKISITAENDVRISASLNENITLTVNNVKGNSITADEGCTLKSEKLDDSRVRYTAVSAPIDESNIITEFRQETIENSGFIDQVKLEGAVCDIKSTGCKTLSEIIEERKNEILEENKVNKGTAVQELTAAGVKVTFPDNVKAVIEAYYEARVSEQRSEAESSECCAFGVAVSPKYRIYVTTASKAADINAGDDRTKAINAVLIADGCDLEQDGDEAVSIKLKLPLPKGFVSSVSEKITVLHYPDDYTKPYAYQYEAEISKDAGGKYYAEFENPDGFSVFLFTKKPRILATGEVNGRRVVYESVGTATYGVQNGGTIYLTQDAGKLTGDEAELYLTGYATEGKTFSIDKTNAPDINISINEEYGYKSVKLSEGNIDTYVFIGDNAAESIKLTASSAYTKKNSIKVTAKLDTGSKLMVENLEKLGYSIQYKFYRSTNKSSGYKALKTVGSKSFTNISGKKGTKYYYKVKLLVYDKDGKLAGTSALKQCTYAARSWKN